MKLELKHLAPYLPYELRIRDDQENNGKLVALFSDCLYLEYDLNVGSYEFDFDQIKPILRPLSDLVTEINWGYQTYSFVSLFNIGDDGGFVHEFDHGNIKLIKSLIGISEHNCYHDINYLPFPVVQLMFENHFDVFGLIPSGLAISYKEAGLD